MNLALSFDPARELTKTPHQVIIVGAGPAGLLLALMLSQRGIPVHLLEAEDKLDGQPRAAHYAAPALPDLERAGVLGEIKKRGIIITDVNYRYAVPVGSADESRPGTGFTRLASMDGNAIRDVDGFDYRNHCLPLQDLCALMLELFVEKHGGQVSWRHRVLRAGQEQEDSGEKGKAWVDVQTPEGERRIEGDYVVGCDGAGSQVRRSLFGSEFPGFTWEKQIVATNTYYDFAKYGFGDVSINVHPDNYYVRALGVTRRLSAEPGWKLPGLETNVSGSTTACWQTERQGPLPDYIWRKVGIDDRGDAGTSGGEVRGDPPGPPQAGSVQGHQLFAVQDASWVVS